MVQGARATSPVMLNELAGTPVNRAIKELNGPICGWNSRVQKLPTTAGDSIIGRRIIVVQKLWPRNWRLMRNARPNPSTTSNATDWITNWAVVCNRNQTSSSVRMSLKLSRPTHLSGRYDMLRLRLVKDSLIIQARGKMLIANNKAI